MVAVGAPVGVPGPTAIPVGLDPVGTVAVAFATSAPPGPTSYCETVLPPPPPLAWLLVTYTLVPSGLTAPSSGLVPAATCAAGGVSAPPAATANRETVPAAALAT